MNVNMNVLRAVAGTQNYINVIAIIISVIILMSNRLLFLVHNLEK